MKNQQSSRVYIVLMIVPVIWIICISYLSMQNVFTKDSYYWVYSTLTQSFMALLGIYGFMIIYSFSYIREALESYQKILLDSGLTQFHKKTTELVERAKGIRKEYKGLTIKNIFTILIVIIASIMALPLGDYFMDNRFIGQLLLFIIPVLAIDSIIFFGYYLNRTFHITSDFLG